ncbi:flagellar hook-associated protein FlgK [Photobacterium damselae]|uniref:flagellar hook-associated protein FlgK n=1 Tax=Photobacterium damselae TaxID=38293 RepID=UPI0040692CAD
MMALDLMQIGMSGLRTSQKQLDVASHNISNVNTPGYSRQVVEQKADDAFYNGSNYYGTGAYIDNVSRAYDQFAARELTLSNTHLEEANVRQQNMMMLDDFTSKSAVNTVNSMNDFYNSVRSLSDHPNDLGARQTVLEQAKQTAQSFQTSHQTLTNMHQDVTDQIGVSLERINTLGQELAAVNTSLQEQAASGKSNDLFDKQRSLINELAKYTKVTVLADKGSLANTVIIGSGDTLVSGVTSAKLKLVNGKPDTQTQQIALVTGNSAKEIKSDGIGGSLGSLLDIRDNVIDKSLDEMGRMAIGFSKQINDLQQQGVDLNGEQGALLFSDVNSVSAMQQRAIKPLGSNAEIKVSIDDVNQLKTGDYQLDMNFDGTNYNYTVTDQDGKQTTISDTSQKQSLSVDGFSINIEKAFSTPTAGQSESILIRPVRDGAANMAVEMSDPKKLAGHSQLTVTPHQANQGSASVTKTVPKLSDALAGDYELKVNNSGDKISLINQATGQPMTLIDDKGSEVTELGYDSAKPQNLTVKTDAGNLSGLALQAGALAGDSFQLNLGRAQATGGNGNFLAMQQVQDQKSMNNGKSSVIDLFQKLSTDIGMAKKNADQTAEVTQLDFDAASERVSNLSGVNLDEEAANLMKFQQSYMASSRIMSVAKETFDTLMRAV